jgi:GDSL-like Lipase/Acylhydrolase family
VKRLQRWLVNGLFLVAAVVVALAAVELGLRTFHPQPTGVWHQDRDGLALHWPGLVSYLPQHGLTVSFNSAGMRDIEHSIEKAPGVFRVLVLGDSFIEALQVPFEESFTSLLQRELAGRTPGRVEVINASVSGWGTDDELQYLTRYGRRFRPDLIVVAMTLYNDVNDNLRERFHMMRDGTLVERTGTRASSLDYKIIQLKGLLASRFQTYQLLIRAKRAREMRVEAQQLSTHVSGLFVPADQRVSRGLELTRLLLERIRVVASEDGGRVVLVLIPLGVQLSDRQFAEFAGAGAGDTQGSQIDRPQRELKRIAERAGIEVIDLLPGFREWAASGGAALYLSRDGHWDRPGHRLATRIVASELVRLGLARR